MQRYFDGTNWGQFAAPTRPPKKNTGKAVLALVGAVFLLIIIGKSCGSDDKKGGSTSSSSATATAPPTPAGPKKPDATFDTPYAGPRIGGGDAEFRYLSKLHIAGLSNDEGDPGLIKLGHGICGNSTGLLALPIWVAAGKGTRPRCQCPPA
jgi:hypothetical protein